MTRDVRALAEFGAALTFESLPAEVIAKVKTTLMHNLGVGLAGHRLATTATALARSLGTGDARLLVDGSRVGVDAAILANAAAIHARTQDDTQLAAQTHFGATVIPALLALGEEADSTGADLVVAVTAAYEIGSHLGRAMGPKATARGFRATTVFAPLAVAAGAAKLLGGGADEIAGAIGHAAAFGGGTGHTWVAGTDEWVYQVGAAARSGVLAARLALAGVPSSVDALTGRSGLYEAFCGGFTDDDAVPGDPWFSFDVTYKPYPICAINQRPVAQVARLLDQREIAFADVTGVELRLTPSEADYPGTRELPPFGGVGAALMSAPLCVAIAVRDGGVTRSSLERYGDAELARVAELVRVVGDDSLGPGESAVAIELGSTIHRDVDLDAVAPFTWDFEEVVARLNDAADDIAGGMAAVARLATAVRDLESISIRALVEATLQ